LRAARSDRSIVVREAAEVALREVEVDEARQAVPTTFSTAVGHVEKNPLMNQSGEV
jgi:hypothetical protein